MVVADIYWGRVGVGGRWLGVGGGGGEISIKLFLSKVGECQGLRAC